MNVPFDILQSQDRLPSPDSPDDRHGNVLWVYIEGDGRAFLSPNRPSSDPTPTDPVALRLALAHPGATPVAYLARPCQYVLTEHGRNCAARYWTNARYAPDVIDSINQAVDKLKKQSGAAQIILAGYSGGGAIAVLAAARRGDVMAIVTVAADLDLAYWTRRDKLTPLDGSLDPANAADVVAYLPQIHFTGGRDDTAGTDVVRSFMSKLPPTAPAHLIEIPDFTHSCCWAEQWTDLLNRPDVKSFSLLE